MGDVIQINPATIESLITQVRAYDAAAADRLSRAVAADSTDAGLGKVYAAASAALRRFEGDSGAALARRAGFFGVSLDPRVASLMGDIDRTGIEGRDRGRDVSAMQNAIV